MEISKWMSSICFLAACVILLIALFWSPITLRDIEPFGMDLIHKAMSFPEVSRGFSPFESQKVKNMTMLFVKQANFRLTRLVHKFLPQFDVPY